MDKMTEHKIIRLLSDDPSYILLLKNRYITDNMWRVVIEQEPSLFKYVENPTNELCIFALQQDGNNLQYIVKNENITLTPEMCYTAVEQYPLAIFDVPQEMRDHGIKEFAFDLEPSLIRNFSNVRKSYIDKKLNEDPAFFRYLDNPDEDIVYRGIERDPNCCVYVKEFTPRIKNLIKTLYPDIIPLLSGYDNDKSDY